MSDKRTHARPSFLSLLGLLLIGLRLAGCIDWPWWAVLAPLWAPLAIVAALALFVGAVEIFEELRSGD
jgi:hypothetical protein